MHCLIYVLWNEQNSKTYVHPLLSACCNQLRFMYTVTDKSMY